MLYHKGLLTKSVMLWHFTTQQLAVHVPPIKCIHAGNTFRVRSLPYSDMLLSLTDHTDYTDFCYVLLPHGDDGFDGFCEHCMLTLLLARCLRISSLLHNLCLRISPRARYGLIAKWACNAHKIRQIRHLRGAGARYTSKKIGAIGAIREL